jgi:hypothetical protein
VPGTVGAESRDGERSVEIDAEHRVAARTALPPGTDVWVGIRPEHLKVDAGRGGKDPSIGKGVVRSVVSDGVAASVVVAWAGVELYTHLLAGRGLARSLTPGEVVGRRQVGASGQTPSLTRSSPRICRVAGERFSV